MPASGLGQLLESYAAGFLEKFLEYKGRGGKKRERER